MDLKLFVDGIKKTGYPLEYETVQTLLDAGWSVISNKYYLDNDENKPREVDVLAYRCSTEHNDYDVYTVLIISCKKSEHSAWTFLTREINLKDQNADWEPTHFSSKSKPLTFITGAADWPKRYHQMVAAKKVKEVLRQPTEEIFAFQEMGLDAKGNERKSNGDGAIFSSVLSLMKAQSYEMSSRAQNKRKKSAIYQFNLVSLAQTNFVRLHFEHGTITPHEIDSAHYIARYIINKQQTFARVFFVRSSKFVECLNHYKALHVANCQILKAEFDNFYANVVKDKAKRDVFLGDFRDRLAAFVELFPQRSDLSKDLECLWPEWNEETSTLELKLDLTDIRDMDFLRDAVMTNKTERLLQEIFRYKGNFVFADDLPF